MKDNDTKLIWEQFNSPGRSRAGNIPFPDGRGEVEEPKKRPPEVSPSRNTSNAAVYDESKRKKDLFDMFYSDLIDNHGGDEPATSYPGLTPNPGDSEALQFLNVLMYITDVMSEAKRDILLDIVDHRSQRQPQDHVDMVYELSELSADELNGLLDGESLPF